MTTITADYFRNSGLASNSLSADYSSNASTAIRQILAGAASQAASSLPARAFADLARVARECGVESWDGYAAIPITKATVDRARAFLNSLPLWMPAPDIVPEADGQIAIEWYLAPDKTFSVSIAEQGPAHYAGRFGPEDEDHGLKSFDGVTVPAKIIELIVRLHRSHTISRAA